MDSITVIRKVLIKSIVTDELKRQLGLQVENAKKNVKQLLKQLEEQKKSLAKGLDSHNNPAQYNLEQEIGKQKRCLDDLENKTREYAALSIGNEFIQGVIDSPCDIKIGDSFFERLSHAEIVLTDGEVVEIKNI
ncbi:MAG: YlqD family protein [Candidatus Wallbacteria bacterium]|nr:YlqD family protein [Candidatus Wallbacteria bacterium]